jgi:hypothetical protein
MNRVYYPPNNTVRKQVRYYEDQQRQKMTTSYKNRGTSPAAQILLNAKNVQNPRPQKQPFFNPNPKVMESAAPVLKPPQQTMPPALTPSSKIQQTTGASAPQKSSSKLIQVSSKSVQNLVEKKETKQALKKSKSKATTTTSKSSQMLNKPLSKSSIKAVRKETKSKTSAVAAAPSTSTSVRVPRTFSVLEAAAKLSFPWTFASIMEARKQQTPGFELISPKRTQLVKEIRRFFASHQDLLPKSRSKRGVAHQLALEMEMDESLETVMQSLKVAYLQEEKAKSVEGYKPVVAPKWEEVETSWPGFESKPLPNWMDYTKPSKIIPYKKIAKSVEVKKVFKAVEGTAGALIAKARRQRMLHHNGQL